MKYTMRQALEIVQRMIAGQPIEASIVSIATMESLGNVVRDALTLSAEAVPAEAGKPAYIKLRKCEIQSGLDRVRLAEGLIRQLPLHHDGRNSWLANYAGEKHEADRIGSPPPALETKDAIDRLKNRIDSALNDHLCGMKPNFDDSIVGFNEAWDIVREKFKGQDGRDPAATDPLLEITYTNYKGETSVRRIAPQSIRFGSTPWHKRPQWLLRAYDVDKSDHREFALGDFGHKSNHLLKEANDPSDAGNASAEARLREALEAVKAAIIEADIEVVTDTLWMPERLSKNETVVDYIDNTLSPAGGDEAKKSEGGPRVIPNPDIGPETGNPEIDSIIHRLLDAQQDINFEANSRMSQSLCDAAALIDEVEAFLRRLAKPGPSSPTADRREIVARIKADPGDGTVAPDIAHVLARGFSAMGWQNPQGAAEDMIDAILAALEKSTAQPHDWIKSTLGHGESMCSRCMITNREAAVLGRLNVCSRPAALDGGASE